MDAGRPRDPWRKARTSRLLVPSAALLWGRQFAFHNPAIALLLVTLFHATAAPVATALVVYNASGFVASLVIPVWADRADDYLRPMLACLGRWSAAR